MYKGEVKDQVYEARIHVKNLFDVACCWFNSHIYTNVARTWPYN